ncbi:MAG: hypothetical protein EHM72_09690 [Calditrichaeota bacterium]|nr:MAG: hypothetical protein EHM72_09690 [Calditrichota bacterium]
MNYNNCNDDKVFIHSTLESGEDFYIKDRWKRQYHFKIASFLVPPGIMIEALEVRKDNSSGHQFRILSEWDADIDAATKKLETIIKNKINKRHLKRRHGQWEIEQYKTVEGRIEYINDPSRTEFDRVFVIDGNEISIEDFVKMLECYEGWSFQFKIVDSCDENNIIPPGD